MHWSFIYITLASFYSILTFFHSKAITMDDSSIALPYATLSLQAIMDSVSWSGYSQERFWKKKAIFFPLSLLVLHHVGLHVGGRGKKRRKIVRFKKAQFYYIHLIAISYCCLYIWNIDSMIVIVIIVYLLKNGLIGQKTIWPSKIF